MREKEFILYSYSKKVLFYEYSNDSLSFVLAAAGVRIFCRDPQASSFTKIYFFQEDIPLVESLLKALEED